MRYLSIGLDFFNRIFDIVISWDSAFNCFTLIFYILIVNVVYRFLLAPIFGGSSGSDEVKKGKKGS